jgi:hypothetical protein
MACALCLACSVQPQAHRGFAAYWLLYLYPCEITCAAVLKLLGHVVTHKARQPHGTACTQFTP